MDSATALQYAKIARYVFEEKSKNYGNQFKCFPTATCGLVSEMFSVLLDKIFEVENVICVYGSKYVNGELCSHAWLEIGTLIIDITSDQFPNGLGEVYVGANCEFYKSFTNQNRDTPPVPFFDSGMLSKFIEDFKQCALAFKTT